MGNTEPRPRHWLPRQWPRDTRQWATLVLLLVVAVALWRVSRVFLLFFGAALFLSGLSGWVRRHTPLSRGWAVGLVLLTLAVLGSAAGWFLAPSVEHHLVRLSSELPQAFADLEQRIRASSLGKELYDAIPDLDGVIGKFSKQLSTATGTTFGVLVDLFVLFFVGLYLAINPDRYVHGFLRLFPAERRQRLEQVASVLAVTLQRWVTGRLILWTGGGSWSPEGTTGSWPMLERGRRRFTINKSSCQSSAAASATEAGSAVRLSLFCRVLTRANWPFRSDAARHEVATALELTLICVCAPSQQPAPPAEARSR